MPITGQIMDTAAVLYNDSEKTVLDYEIQLPYLNMALKELQEIFQQNNVPVTSKTSAVIPINANVSSLSFSDDPLETVAIPSNFIDIERMWESPRGINQWIPMYRQNFLPHYLENNQINQLVYFSFNGQQFQFLPANADNDIKLDYIKSLFAHIQNPYGQDIIDIINSELFLSFRIAGLAAEFIGENIDRATSLNNNAYSSLERSLGISAKGRQAIVTRRRPFRASYRGRGYMY